MYILPGALLILFSTCTITDGLFAPNSDLVYNYHAIIRTGTLTPERASSDWELKGILRLQVADDTVIVKFNNLSVSLFNGKLVQDSESDKLFQHIPDEANDLYKPFVVHYEEGKVKHISASVEDSVWSVNMKRALGSFLQLEEEKFNLPAFITKENSIFGNCNVEYTVSSEGNKFLIRKFINHLTCQGYPRLVWKNTSPLMCPSGHNILSSTSGRFYFLVAKNNLFHLERLEVKSGFDVQPFHALGELNYAFVNQTISLISAAPIVENIILPENMALEELTFKLPSNDPTQNRSPLTDEECLKMVDIYLKRIIDSLEKNPFQNESELMHNEYVPHLLYFLSLLRRPYLEQYYNNLAIGTSYYQETHRNLFLKLLPQVGSDDSILLIQDLVFSGKEKEKVAVELLTILPFYIRHPSEDLLKTSEKLLDLGDNIVEEVKRSAVLTFSIMVNKICRSSCNPETLDKYVRLFVDKFASSQSYSEQMLYLEVLSNIEVGNAFYHMIPIIQGNVSIFTEQPHHIRFLGVWASMSQAIFHPQKVYEIYWPILTNRSEHLEMRVAALTMLILSNPSHGNFINLLWFMKSEKNAHLLHFYYTTLESLIDSKYPCYTGLGKLASYVIRYVQPPAIRNWATGNYILDYSDSKFGFGGLAQLFAVANQHTGNPNVLYFLVNSHAMDQNLRQFAFYIKLGGVSDAVKQMGLMANNKFTNFSSLTNILKEINAPIISSEDIHIEIILKTEDRVVYCQYINRTNFYKLIEVVSKIDLLTQELSINYQTVKAPALVEITQPSEIGVPVLYKMESAIITSIRGNFTKDWSGSDQFRRNELDVRYSLNSCSSLIVYNPVLNLWHSAKRSISFDSYFASNISVYFNKPQMKIAFADPASSPRGFTAHTRTTVNVYGANSSRILHSHCQTCDKVFVVSGNNKRNKQEIMNIQAHDLGTNIRLNIFDCEQSYSTNSILSLIKTAFFESNMNYRVLPISRLFLGVLYSIDHLSMIPPKGSCGLKLLITPSTEEGTEVVVAHSYEEENTKKQMKYTLDLISSSSRKNLKSWILSTEYETKEEDTLHDLGIEITSLIDGKVTRKVCFIGGTTFPKRKNGLFPWNHSDDVTSKGRITWGSESESIKCPSNEGDIDISVLGEVTEEQKRLLNSSLTWPHSTCLEDTKKVEEWGQGYTPITEACYRASVEVATLRKYTAILSFKKVPKSFNELRKKAIFISELFNPGFIIHSSEELSNLTIAIEIPVDKQIFLSVNNQLWVLPKAANWLKQFLINTYIQAAVPHLMTFGLMGSCVVNSANVITVDNMTRSFSATPYYTLVSGDCTTTPTFAVFLRRVSGGKPLASKLYVDGYVIEIVPTANGDLKVLLNDEYIVTDYKGHQVLGENKQNLFLIKQLEGGLVRVTSQNAKIWLQHNGHFLTLVMTNSYRGKLCGLCGDFNGDASNDAGEVLSLPHSDAPTV